MKLIIDRAKWLRGDCDQSTLLDSAGKMCCLGFFGRACGIPASALRHQASPEGVRGEEERWPSWLLQYIDERGRHGDTKECSDLIRQNDAANGPVESEREEKIAAIFAKHGVTVEFVG